MTHTHLGLHELADRLGVSKTRAGQIRATAGFPAPCAELRSGPVWHEADVDRWLAAHAERRPGRPRKATP